MHELKSLTVPASLPDGAPDGSLEAVFSTFDIVDSDGDIVAASAFTDGQAVPLTWAHDWTQPVGKGVIRVLPDRAVFAGQFFLDTAAGREAYQTVKNMGDLQEYSWGFRVLDSDYAERDGQDVRVITKAEVYEVSPVLVGANRQTGTLALKRLLTDGHESGLTFADEADAVLAAARRFAERAAALAATRAKDGRMLSAANVDRLQSHAGALHQVANDLMDLCAAAAPKAATVPRETVEALRIYSRMNGVPV